MSVSREVEESIKREVQILFPMFRVEIGRVVSIEETSSQGLYLFSVESSSLIVFRGLALYRGPFHVEVFLDSRAMYMIIMTTLTERLESYTREHPWIAGL